MTTFIEKRWRILFSVATKLNILAQFELKKLHSVPDIGDLTYVMEI